MLPVVMISTLTGSAERVRCNEAGADGFLPKPVTKIELVSRRKSLLRMKGAFDDLADRHESVLRSHLAEQELLRRVLHDFKNPLTVIETSLELMEMKEFEASWGHLRSSQYNCRVLYHT